MNAILSSPKPGTTPAAFDGAAYAQLERMMDDLARLYRERNDALQAVTWAHHDALVRLAFAAELRDEQTGVHIVRIGYLAERLAQRLDCGPAWSERLRMAAPMHDVGKIGIPDAVLKKPGPLTPAERAVMNGHPALGAQILGSPGIPLFALAAEVALTHHERWDGQGYPQGCSGDRIPLAGRIVAVADYFDALTMDRCYRPAFSDDEALTLLQEQRGHAFDPRVVDAFLAHAGEMMALRDEINARQPDLRELMQDPRRALQGPALR